MPRTATRSLKLALPLLTGGPCYHMTDVFDHPEHIPTWQRALDGHPPDWHEFLGGYSAAVDWPASALWRQLAEAFPDAPIVLSTRTDGETWWRSADATIMEGLRQTEDRGEWWEMCNNLWQRTLCSGWADPLANADAYERYVNEVRRTAPPERLLEWRAREGWAPLCEALGVPIPDGPFPHANSTEEWQERRRQRQLEQEGAEP